MSDPTAIQFEYEFDSGTAEQRTKWIPPPHLDRGVRTNDYHHPERLFNDEDRAGP
ncbi:hypothetical protein [Mycobacterium riyadhense]|uniref:hypothetical protein n=1 Tax=Mycobacterium riyadhense TaxID=486698 RepID=UPI00146FC801|nr:hypothetical protein [Mycobacterium riyadhense]MCV7146457.1 hypothetical protein [Mycobacterium riyadhense]